MPVTVKDKSLLTPEQRAEAEAPARAIVAASKYAGTPFEGFIRYMDRWSNERRTETDPQGRTREQWYSTLTYKPYMETAGRLAEANDDHARPILALRTWLNDTAEPLEVTFREDVYLVPARHAKAVLVRSLDGTSLEQVFEADEAIRRSDKGVDASHPLANAQTSAIGRVLGNAGYGLLPGSSISPAETMATTPQDVTPQDEGAVTPKAEPKPRSSSKKVEPPRLEIEALEAIQPYLLDLHEGLTEGALKTIAARIAADADLATDQIAYLRAAYTSRLAELREATEPEGDVDAAA